MSYSRSLRSLDFLRKKPELYNNALKAVQSTGANDLETSVLMDIAAHESGYNPTAKNKTSSATGMFQFTTPTWSDYLKASASARLANHDRTNPANAAQATLFYARKGQLGRWNASKSKWAPGYKPQELAPFYKRK